MKAKKTKLELVHYREYTEAETFKNIILFKMIKKAKQEFCHYKTINLSIIFNSNKQHFIHTVHTITVNTIGYNYKHSVHAEVGVCQKL